MFGGGNGKVEKCGVMLWQTIGKAEECDILCSYSKGVVVFGKVAQW